MNDTVIICEGSKFIDLDQGSGGYPVRVSSPWDAKHWRTVGEAQLYRETFPKEKWTIKIFRATALWDIDQIQNAVNQKFGKAR